MSEHFLRSYNSLFRPWALMLLALIATLDLGCNQAEHTPANIRQSSKATPSGEAKLFNYTLDQITELTIGKFDPSTGENWLTSLKRTDAPTQRKSSPASWEFTSPPDGTAIRDRKANATFIMHLLDSFQGLHKIGDAPKGTLDSLGLDPPRYVIRFRTNASNLEFQVGGLSDDQLGNYLTTDRKQVIIASGSALKMLPLIRNFEYLRDRSWTSLSPDDTDEFVLSGGGKPFFYAQREGSQWNDKKHHPIALNVRPKLKQAVHQDAESILKDLAEVQPKEFIDDPGLVKMAQNMTPTYEAELIDRHGSQSLLKIVKVTQAKNQSILCGLSSSRPWTLFVLDPKVLTTFENSKLFSTSTQ